MQTWALLVDSYRLLMNRKLFWITLAISGIVVILYASMGFDETGTFAFFGLAHWDSEVFREGTQWSKALYLNIFSFFIVGIWLTWAATILALMSTAPILNDFLADGSIDLTLSKPVSRAWVFLVKYIGGLLFVILQVAFFSLGVFLCVAWRLGEWRWSVFWAVPLITVFFSYLYCVNVLMTMLTRSTLASLLITMVFWGGLFAVGYAERKMNEVKIQSEVMAEMTVRQAGIQQKQRAISRAGSKAPKKRKPPTAAEIAARKRIEEQQKKAMERRRERQLETARSVEKWRSGTALVLAFLPKTKQTTDILDRKLIEPGKSFWGMMFGAAGRNQPPEQDPNQPPGANQMFDLVKETERRMQEHYDSVSAWYILGTSLAFEAVILGFACFLFYRRDF